MAGDGRIDMRVPRDIIARVRALAMARGLTVTALILTLLLAELERDERRAEPEVVRP